MDTEREVERLLDRHRREAVLLHRPYPPHEGPRTNSRFGGLPRLPASCEWPRTPDGVAPHFLAQVDCADIGFPTALPERGVLFFFGRDDDEQVWDRDRPPEESCRVLYALDAFALTPERAPPADLRPIGGGWPRADARPFLREGEPGPTIHVAWPIQPRRVDTWPDAGAFYGLDFGAPFDWRRLNPACLFENAWQALTRRSEAYERIRIPYTDVVERRRADAWYTAAGVARPAEDLDWLGLDSQVATGLYGEDGGPDAWPRLWIEVAYFCRAARTWLSRGYGIGRSDPPDTATVLEGWLARAEAHSPVQPMADGERTEVRRWIASLSAPGPPPPLRSFASQFVTDATVATVRAFAGDPDRSRLVPAGHYDLLAPRLRDGSVWGVKYSQMLGHAPSLQDPLALDDPTVCLLNLVSDAGLGWMFGDMGECTFWIAPGDLARRDFGKAWGTIEGH